MPAEVLKWLQGIGVGALATLYQYVQGVQGTSWWEIAVLAVLVRVVGFVVSKYTPAPVVPAAPHA